MLCSGRWPTCCRRRPTSRICRSAHLNCRNAPRFLRSRRRRHVALDRRRTARRAVGAVAADIRDLLSTQRAVAPRAWIFTSATLGDDEALSWFSEAAALEDATKLRVDSPFDYPRMRACGAGGSAQAQRREPRTGDRPTGARLAARLHGRTFVLTTTLRVLEPIAQALRDAAERAGMRTRGAGAGHAAASAACCSAFCPAAVACWWARRVSGRASTCPRGAAMCDHRQAAVSAAHTTTLVQGAITRAAGARPLMPSPTTSSPRPRCRSAGRGPIDPP